MKAWLARDKSGELWLYFNEKPWKDGGRWYIRDIDEEVELDTDHFSSVKWEDEEPTEIEIIIKSKKK